MPSKTTSSESITSQLKDRKVAHVEVDGLYRLRIHFTDGKVLALEAAADRLIAIVERFDSQLLDDEQPTKRQHEYLVFIAKYIARFGQSPAESDIQRHFLVSAPSVNQMMQMLERRKFITRQPGVPRSIRVCTSLPVSSLKRNARNDA